MGRPGFVSPPSSRTNNAGTTAQFQTIAGGTELLSYQWFKAAMPLTDQDNVTGATSRTLTLAGVLKADEGAYHLVVSNAFGTVTSLVVTLTVRDPAILVPPLDTYRAVGESVSLSVTAGGTPPLNYQWFHDGVALPGATGPGLTINSLSVADAGYYTVQVSNVLGSVTSSPVPLTVNGATVEADFNPAANGPVYSLAVQTDGKILVGGSFTTLNGQSRNYCGRLNADGTLDATFNPGANSVVNRLAVQADGKILLSGQFTTLNGQPRISLGRLNPDGTLDGTFNPGAPGYINSLVVQADGKVLVGGDFSTLGGQTRTNLGRLNPDGTLDATFNSWASGAVVSLAIQADGKILVGGSGLHRLNPNGTLDSTFNPGAPGYINSLVVQADGKILVGGYFFTLGGQPPNSLGRLNADGTLDTTFNPGASGDDDEESYSVSSLALQTDGKILVGGHFTTLGGKPRNHLGRLNADGTLDHTFNPGVGGRDRPYFDSVDSLAVQADGKILVGGNFSTLGDQPRRNLARLENTSPATQLLAHDGSTITWLRGGTSPEVWRTTFESSADGVDWTFLGAGTRISGGWQLAGVSLSPVATVRARGYSAGGDNASGWFVETTWSASVPIRLHLVREGATLVLNWTGGQGPYQVQQTADFTQPGAWQNLGPAAHTNSMALPLGPGSLFLRVRGQ